MPTRNIIIKTARIGRVVRGQFSGRVSGGSGERRFTGLPFDFRRRAPIGNFSRALKSCTGIRKFVLNNKFILNTFVFRIYVILPILFEINLSHLENCTRK